MPLDPDATTLIFINRNPSTTREIADKYPAMAELIIVKPYPGFDPISMVDMPRYRYVFHH